MHTAYTAPIMSQHDIDVESLPLESSEEAPEMDRTEVKGEGQQGSIIVDFDGPTDPQNPLNWSTPRKTASIIIVSLTALLS